MQKKAKQTKYKAIDNAANLAVNEPVVAAYSGNTVVAPLGFAANYSKYTFHWFQTVASSVPFTQKEWANILHLSERTLQRYALANTAFDGIYVDRILQVQALIQLGLQAFTTSNAFYAWLKQEKQVMGQLLTFESLNSYQGIVALSNQINRMIYGVYA